MHNVRTENVQEHSLQVAIVAHALAVIGNKHFGKKFNPERVALLGIFHDASEVITGDMPTPVKYFNPEIKNAYKEIENDATNRLLSYLPADLKPEYETILFPHDKDAELWKLVKAADTICAYIKCLEEGAAGNKEFNRARASIEAKLKSIDLPEVEYFQKNFIHSFSLTLDELSE